MTRREIMVVAVVGLVVALPWLAASTFISGLHSDRDGFIGVVLIVWPCSALVATIALLASVVLAARHRTAAGARCLQVAGVCLVIGLPMLIIRY